MEPIREKIEDFMRRYWVRVLAVAVGVLLALLALLLVRRALRVISGVLVPALIGAVLAAWLVLGPLSAPDRAQTSTSVENGVVWACERKVPHPLAEDQVWVEGMRKDCGIYPPLGDGTLAAYDDED